MNKSIWQEINEHILDEYSNQIKFFNDAKTIIDSLPKIGAKYIGCDENIITITVNKKDEYNICCSFNIFLIPNKNISIKYSIDFHIKHVDYEKDIYLQLDNDIYSFQDVNKFIKNIVFGLRQKITIKEIVLNFILSNPLNQLL